MTDKLSPEERSINMSRIRAKDTVPEMIVRKIAHRLGYRYRLHRKDLPGKPDLVFPKKKKVIYVHGCFWHQHEDPNCKIRRKPKSNEKYWIPKLEGNVLRDHRHQYNIKNSGWEYLIIWECETKDLELIKSKLIKFLEDAPPNLA